MTEPIALEMLLDKLRADRPIKLSRIVKSKMRFSGGPLAPNEKLVCGTVYCTQHDTEVTEYQYRALAILGDSFHEYACKKYPPEDAPCVWTLDEFKAMFNEIHRGVDYFVKQGLSVKEALHTFINGKKFNTVPEVEEV